jgi:nucleoid DNA-binding protein
MAVLLSDLIQTVAEKTGVSQDQTREVIHTMLTAIGEGLVTDEEARLSDFGVFEVRRMRPRYGRNPRTGERITIPGKAEVRFRPGSALKRVLGHLQESEDES